MIGTSLFSLVKAVTRALGDPKNKAMLMAKFYGPGFGLNEDNYLEISYLNSFKRCFDDLYLAIPDQFANSTEKMVEFLKPVSQKSRFK